MACLMMLVTVSLSTRSRAVLCNVIVTGVVRSVVVVTVKPWSEVSQVLFRLSRWENLEHAKEI